MKTESKLPDKWARAEAMTVHELLEETSPAAVENVPDAAVVSYQAMGLCAGRHAKAVVFGLLLASLRILTDCEEDGSFEIPNAAIVGRGTAGMVGGSRLVETEKPGGISCNPGRMEREDMEMGGERGL